MGHQWHDSVELETIREFNGSIRREHIVVFIHSEEVATEGETPSFRPSRFSSGHLIFIHLVFNLSRDLIHSFISNTTGNTVELFFSFNFLSLSTLNCSSHNCAI